MTLGWQSVRGNEDTLPSVSCEGFFCSPQAPCLVLGREGESSQRPHPTDGEEMAAHHGPMSPPQPGGPGDWPLPPHVYRGSRGGVGVAAGARRRLPPERTQVTCLYSPRWLPLEGQSPLFSAEA